jgi:peptidoglycan hydrolase-like protein with peptidoglycan-binding domain
LVAAAPVLSYAQAACSTLSLGSSGSGVTALQNFFVNTYSNFPQSDVTGYFGPLTQAAVEEWQSDHGIVSSGSAATTGWGIVGPRTRAAMGLSCIASSSPNTGSTAQPSSKQSLLSSLLAQLKALEAEIAALTSPTSTQPVLVPVSGGGGGSSGGGGGGGGGGPPPPSSCTLNGATVASGASQTFYSNAAVSYGASCANYAQTRTCTNGTLSGDPSYQYSSCAVGNPNACSFNNQPVASGASVTAYQASSVGYGQQCLAQTRTCTNGTLSGTYQYASCSVSGAASCTFNNQTIQNGATVTAYQASSVPSGSQCVSQTRTCSNGTLSGTYAYGSCTIQQQTSSCPSGWICPAPPVYTSTIGTWYWPLYDAPTSGRTMAFWWGYIDQRVPVIGYYTSDDPSTLSYEFAHMKAAGIQYVVLDGTNLLLPASDDSRVFTEAAGSLENAGNITNIFNDDAGFPTSQQMPLAVAIGGQLQFASTTRTAQQDATAIAGQNAEANYVFSHWASSPLYFQWQGKPLLINYNNFMVSSVADPGWDDPFQFSVRNSTGYVTTVNNDPNAFDPNEPSLLAPYGSHGWWGWVVAYPQPISSEEMTVSPGGDNRWAGGIVNVGRQGGLLYEKEWLYAIAHNPGTIFVASWNGFSDGNAVEASSPATGSKAVNEQAWTDTYGTEVPDWYEQITSAYGNLKTGLMPGDYYRDVNGSDIYQVVNGQLVCQSALPHGHPVIPLPAGLLASLKAQPCGSSTQSGAIADFGGMYGLGGVGTSTIVKYPNPATGDVSCPAGYSASQVLGTSGLDWPMNFCSQTHTATSNQIYDFGGMYGYGWNTTTNTANNYLNPATNGMSCPTGYTASQVLGTSGQDWPVYFCYAPHTTTSQPVYYFGGMYGYGSPSNYPNPLTGSLSCPAGYTSSQVLGTPNADWPVYFCYKAP